MYVAYTTPVRLTRLSCFGKLCHWHSRAIGFSFSEIGRSYSFETSITGSSIPFLSRFFDFEEPV